MCIDIRTHCIFWYFCELLTTWLIWKFYFWTVFFLIIWFDIYHIVCIWYVIYLSGDISGLQIITSINANRYMWKVHISTILEGFNCPILGKKGFAEVIQKAGEFPPYSYSHLMCFDIPPIVGVWDIITISGDLSDWQIITSIHIYCTA